MLFYLIGCQRESSSLEDLYRKSKYHHEGPPADSAHFYTDLEMSFDKLALGILIILLNVYGLHAIQLDREMPVARKPCIS